MTEKPWTLPSATADTPRLCHVCGDPLPDRRGAIYLMPHSYHMGCYGRLHAALWDKANEGKTLEQIRALVAEDVKKAKTR
jgi:hypothetical protein